MPAFKPVVLRNYFREDGTVSIRIKISHKNKARYIDTGLRALIKKDITSSLKIKNTAFIDSCNALIRDYWAKCNEQPHRINNMEIDQLVSFLTEQDLSKITADQIDFIQFAREQISTLEQEGRAGVATNYRTTVNRLIEFTGQEKLPASYITYSFLLQFEKYITNNSLSKNNKGMSRAPSLYMSNLRALFNRLKLKYNDEEQGVIPIPYSPFAKYKLPQEKQTRKRAVDHAIIRMISRLPDSEAVNSSGSNRFNLAKDCFLLSFGMMGINSTDLYDCPPIKGGHLTYKRKKSRSRRKDEALIKVQIQPEIEDLVNKYKDPEGIRAFNFYHSYANAANFNKAINKGLKLIEEVINRELEQSNNDYRVEDLEYYAARHSWASIALNKVKINKYIVHEALNHVVDEMKITEIYLDKDWSLINEANRKVLSFVLNTHQGKVIKLKAV